MILLLIGPPGAGKGTQGARLAERLGIEHIAAGDLLRAEVANATPIGQQAAAIMDRGELVPDSVILELLLPRVLQAAEAGGYLLDGFPRSVEQAERVRHQVADIGGSPDAAIYLDASHDVLVQRLLERARIEGRVDDTAEVI